MMRVRMKLDTRGGRANTQHSTAMDGVISKLEALVGKLESSGGSGARVAKVLTRFITTK